MFDTESLLKKILRGNATQLTLNGTPYYLSQADDFSWTDSQVCSGTIPDCNAAFELQCVNVSDCEVVFTLTLHNRGSEKIICGNTLLFSFAEEESHCSGGEEQSQRAVFSFNDSLESKNYVLKAVDHGGIHNSRPMCLIFDLSKKESFFSAQYGFEKNHVIYEMQFDPACGRLLNLSCMLPVPDYELKVNESVTFDPVMIRKSSSGLHPQTLLDSWADAMAEKYNIKPASEIPAGFLCGWLISTKAEKTDSQIRRNMETAQGVLRKLGVKYVWTSIDNLPDGMPGNWLESNTENFKDTVPVFLQEIREKGFIPGLWIAPYLVGDGSADLEKVRPHLIRDRKTGKESPRFRWYWGKKDEQGLLPMLYSLDSDREESFQYIKKIFETYASWGVRYFMMDFLSTGVHTSEDESGSFCEESYRKFLRRIPEFCTEDTFLLSAVGSRLSLIGAVSSGRVGLDYGEARQLEENFESYPANYVINGSFGSSGAPNRNAVQNLAMWGFAHGKFFSCNSNVMTVDKPVPLKEARIAATLFGMSPSPVFFQDDFARMSPDRLALVKKVLPRCPGMPLCVNLFTKTDLEQDFVRIFVKNIEKEWGAWSVCCIFNLNDSMRSVTLDAAELTLDPDAEYWMYDFWDECYMGTFHTSRTLEVPANSCVVLRFTRKESHPWVLSTDLHVLQGQAELQSVRWDEETMTLSGVMQHAAGERGNLFLAAPPYFREKYFNKGMLAAKSAFDRSLIIKVPLVFEKDSLEWKVEFVPCSGPEVTNSKGEI